MVSEADLPLSGAGGDGLVELVDLIFDDEARHIAVHHGAVHAEQVRA